MLTKITAALQQFNENGVVIIPTDGEHDSREIAGYVLLVLNGLKCSIEHHYSDKDLRYYIRDTM